MNKQRRKSLHVILDGLEKLRDPIGKAEALDIIQKSASKVNDIADEEQEALDARPETLQWSAANGDMEDNISDLTDAASDLEVLAEKCEELETYSYEAIKSDVIGIVRKINLPIHR